MYVYVSNVVISCLTRTPLNMVECCSLSIIYHLHNYIIVLEVIYCHNTHIVGGGNYKIYEIKNKL